MLFTSPVFLLLFLPLMLGIYTLTPPRLRPRAILIFNLAFYALACFESPASLLFILLCAVFTYCAAFAVFSVKKTYPIIFVVCVLFGVLAVLRYLGVWADEAAARRYLPIGASFYLLSCLSCIVDIRRGDAPMPRRFIEVLTYITFFPVMIAGPVIKYKNFRKLIEPESLHFTAAGVSSGIILFAQGFIKRVAIASFFDASYDSIVERMMDYTEEPISIGVGFILALLLLTAVYFAFSGYSDMARGICAMLGISLQPDFGVCLLVHTPMEYANNFLASLGEWIRDYIRRPLTVMLPGNIEDRRKKKALNALISAICALFLLLWFKIGIRVLPAIAILLIPPVVGELVDLKELFERKKILKTIGSIATFLFVTLFWMLIRTRDLSSLEVIFGNITIGKPLQYYLTSQTLINLELPIILAFIALVQLPVILGVTFKRHQSPFLKSGKWRFAWSMLLLAVFILCIYYYLPQYPALATEPFRDIIF
jgi:alginate O-acetyltransferase complex protein AlgI